MQPDYNEHSYMRNDHSLLDKTKIWQTELDTYDHTLIQAEPQLETLNMLGYFSICCQGYK